ncbi:MAG TPA: transcription-repair coupling factor, partial [Caulobacteraceae bacterium]|nr:transcription-repair coupling factor [Caulobacteraceae bacterium]
MTLAEARRPDVASVAAAAGALELAGAPEGFDALVMADIARARGGLCAFVARDGTRASAFMDAFGFFAPDIEILHFPSWDCLPYDRVGPSPGAAARRMATLARLVGPRKAGPRLLVTQVPALLQRVPPRELLTRASYAAKVGQDVDIKALERYFAVNGYSRASTVSERGEFAIRGGVIDVFPPGAEEPVRLDLFGDMLESIRAFDPMSQRSTRKLDSIEFLPVSEVLLEPDTIARFRQGYVTRFGASADDPLYAAVSEGVRRSGVEHFLPLFYPTLETLFDYLGKDVLIGLDHLARDARDERLATVADAFEARREADKGRGAYHALEPDALHLSIEEWDKGLSGRPMRAFNPFHREEASGVIDLGAKAGRNFAAERAQDSVNLFAATVDHAKRLTAAGKRVLFASWSDGSSDRLGVMLGDHGLDVTLAADWPEAERQNAKIAQR